MTNEHLAAVCGLYCGACGLYRARHDNNPEQLEEIIKTVSERWGIPAEEEDCDGCLSGGKLSPYCRTCPIMRCPSTTIGVKRCSDCPHFPCTMITSFNNDGVRHHAEVFANIKRQREIGVAAWLKEQEQRWQCQGCGTPMAWYTRVCYKCGKSQPYRLPSLPRDKK